MSALCKQMFTNIYVKESDSEDRWYKSTKTVDYSKLTEFYRASTIIELGK